MLILQGIPFGTFAVVSVGSFPKLTNIVFSAERRELLVPNFILFLGGLHFYEADSTAQTSKATF
jgi:hypothetical protein